MAQPRNKKTPFSRLFLPANDHGFGVLEGLVAGAILAIAMTVSLSVLSKAAKRNRRIESKLALLPMEEAVVGGTINAVWGKFQAAASKVPQRKVTCNAKSCQSSFSGMLPVEYIDFPSAWLVPPPAASTFLPAGPHLLTPVGANLTQAVGFVPSSVLAQADPSTNAYVDPVYCNATVTNTVPPSSYVFRLQTVVKKSGDPGYAAYYSFFNSLYRPITPTVGNEPPFSPQTGDFPVVPNTTYRFARDGADIKSLVFNGGDGWLTTSGAAVFLPPYLGFFWTNSKLCSEATPLASVCNTTSTPIKFDFMAGDVSVIKLTSGGASPNAPAVQAGSEAAKALTRCAKQTLDLNGGNYGLQDELYFCLLLQKPVGGGFTSVLAPGVKDAFGEFIFRLRSVTNNAPLNCASLADKLRVGANDYYGELSFTMYWTDTASDSTPFPRIHSGSISRMGMP